MNIIIPIIIAEIIVLSVICYLTINLWSKKEKNKKTIIFNIILLIWGILLILWLIQNNF